MSAIHRLKHAVKRVISRSSPAGHSRKRTIAKFGEKMGFVYFGSVDQHDDEHHIIRGLTVSSTHHDEHYSVGSMDGYDISIVERTDLIGLEKALKSHRWLVFEFDLHSTNDIPHAVLTASGSADTSFAQLVSLYPTLHSAPLGTLEEYSQEFLHRYATYTTPTHFIEVERYFSSDVTRYIAAHFWPMTIEISDNSLFLYMSEPTVTNQLLETMLRSGLWLAEQLDSVNT